jgi:hypothetical protein
MSIQLNLSKISVRISNTYFVIFTCTKQLIFSFDDNLISFIAADDILSSAKNELLCNINVY